MYVKIAWKEDGKTTISGHECKKYYLWEQDDGIFLRFDELPETHEIRDCQVYVMSDDGQTMDRLN